MISPTITMIAQMGESEFVRAVAEVAQNPLNSDEPFVSLQNSSDNCNNAVIDSISFQLNGVAEKNQDDASSIYRETKNDSPLKEENEAPDKEDEDFLKEKTQKRQSKSKKDKSNTSAQKEIVPEIDLDWDLLGDKALYEINQVSIESSGGSERIDNVIADTLSTLDNTKPEKPKSRFDSKKDKKKNFSLDDSSGPSDFMQAMMADQTKHSSQSANNGKYPPKRKT